jgi:hypothetical protein
MDAFGEQVAEFIAAEKSQHVVSGGPASATIGCAQARRLSFLAAGI